MTMDKNLAVSVRGLGKDYVLKRNNEEEPDTLLQASVNSLKRVRKQKTEILHAVRDMSFDVGIGEAVGLIGPNGAGKSTTLKLLNRITHPTTGEIRIRGRIGSLLEVGTGFHPELTGRENVYLSASILGMNKAEVDGCFDEIVEFSGVSRFLETPVKRYSSGMYVRLAFSVAAHLPSEVLLVDEVLAVGDADFKSKSLARMRQIISDGRTIIFVSHHMPSIRELCQRAITISRGTVVFDGDPQDAIDHYHGLLTQTNLSSTDDQSRRVGTGEHRLISFQPTETGFATHDPKRFSFQIQCQTPVDEKFGMVVWVMSEAGETIAHCDSRLLDHWFAGDRDNSGEFVLEHPWLHPGRYTVIVDLIGNEYMDQSDPACVFDVVPDYPYPMPASTFAARGRFLSKFDFSSQANVDSSLSGTFAVN